jgi:N-acetylmuramoyl-L-alanine amidase
MPVFCLYYVIRKEILMSKKYKRLAIILSALLIMQGLFSYCAFAREEKLQECPQLACYTVKEGDTLSGISRKCNVSLGQLIRFNKLTSTLIHPGEILVIPGREEGMIPETLSRGGISREDLLLLARIIYAEARGESFSGQVAVGAVILNRVAHPRFPKTIREVIMESNPYVHQFTPVQDGSINLEPDEIAINAAIQAFMKKDPTNGALFFYNPRTATDTWIRKLPVIARIGNHVFAKRA